ncbi:hypothetical protein N7468_009074 [Penicillium chermesinum]|uniref:Mediator of RNA polymerase II transcription subunit 12 n=1 Tax=Penicillium chermesinum TaxID=63820 RepID=A0A9W9NH16_9EURO|nr:uncharacterized protein N7468_009074 [Penicillium chermesinum]KAJ5219870.1 hypothetical protein N7468_009074 [Penicillium chermesinum]
MNRTLNGGPGRVDLAQLSAQYDSPMTSQLPLPSPSLPRPLSQNRPVVDLTSAESQDREPVPKRPRLDVPSGPNSNEPGSTGNGGEARSTPGSAGSRPPPSWRGRPMWSFQAVMSELPTAENRGEHATGAKSTSPPPLPTQSWNVALSEVSGDGVSKSRDPSPDKKVQTTPYRIAVPSVAPVLKGDKVADFTPWTGNHPEDVLNESTAKQGYYDRTQVSQNESNTARPALYTQLKHRTGLQMLSTVFAAALEKRRNHNTAWLRDLANPAVSLRRLSRTIPHGIRGKIRAFKRKGTSGALAVGLEAKWVRDWTTSVQQFVEGVFGAPKAPDWKTKMTYAVGLTARLFFENLLDHDHFLEWFLASFESASLATVPVWLLMLGIYWNNLLRYRKRGRRLAELLLDKLSKATETKLQALQPLIDRLSRFVNKLVYEHTSSMILPNSWNKYKAQISSCMNLAHHVDRALFQSLLERNARIQRPANSKQETKRTPNQRLIRLLDSVRSAQDISTVSEACLDTLEDRAVLISKLMEWIATPFRYGICRVYVGVRLLRKWKGSGIDVDDHILSFLSRMGGKRLNLNNIYHAISELVRSQTFSVGRYLQWLMAKGSANHSSDEKLSLHDLPGDIGLIAQLPVGRLPEHVRNLRNTLLVRTGLQPSVENSTIASVKQLISQRLPEIFGGEVYAESPLGSLTDDLSWAIKAEIGQWLRRGVADHFRDASSSSIRPAPPCDILPLVSALTPDEFYSVREILETFGDISMLADVLRCASSSDDSTVLASVADTTNRHFESLCVIGATPDLFRRLVDAYAGIKRFAPPSLDLMFSLIELGLRIPNELNSVIILRQDLSRMENKTVLAASSPVSDHIPDSFNDADPMFREKLDQLLLPGTVMDEPTLDTIFSTLTKHLESGCGQVKLSANDTCLYLAQLRSFQPKHFDGALARWVCAHLRSPDRSILFSVLPSLIGVGCVTIRSFLSLLKRLSHSSIPLPNAASIPADLLGLLVPRENATRYLDLVSYRFQLAQQEFLSKNTDEILEIICNSASGLSSERQSPLEDSMIMLLRELLVRNPACTGQSYMKKLVSQHPVATKALQKALDDLLGFDSQEDNSIMLEVEKLASTTDDFSLPFCQLKLQVLFRSETTGNEQTNIVDAMFKTVVADSRVHRLHWVDLVALMSPESVCQIRERAERELFAIPLLEDSNPINGLSTGSIESLESAKVYLSIIEELAGTVHHPGTSSIAPVLVEKMEALLHKIITAQASVKQAGDTKAGSTPTTGRTYFERSLAFWFSALLRMVVLHRASFTQTSPNLKAPSAQEQSRLLICILCIALSRLPGDLLRLFPGADYFPHPGTSEPYHPCPGILLQTHALDVAASLIDVFPDEIRHHCCRFLKEKCPPFAPLQNDSRFLYLLGPTVDAYSHGLLQSAAASSPAASGSTSTPAPAPTNIPASNPSSQAAFIPAAGTASSTENPDCVTSRLRLQHRGRIVGPYPIRAWELLEDAAPFVGANDTAVNLGYFDARRVRV